MGLSPGTRIGTYEVIALLGEGGMGQVYRARDTRLDRDVALKIIPEALANDPDRVARFDREARTLASLSHPNIAIIHGVEQGALVMEFIDGDDLSAHVARGPMSLHDALPVAKQIVDALEAAHESGIVHRDLKPANIKVRADGSVKVLDFGLAKALDTHASGAADVMNSPTLTARATQMGMIIGTAAYMAPEQARGRAVDRRADIWAFGVVLYEMLSGRRAFDGDDVSITLAGVLKEDVNWDALPADTPPALRTLIKRCLEKDPKRRLGWIGEARYTLDDPAAASATLRDVGAAHVETRGSAARRLLPWALASALAVALIAAFVMWAPWKTMPPPASHRLEVKIGAAGSMPVPVGAAAVLSPDGQTLAFVAAQAGQSLLFVRKLNELQAKALPGTDNAGSPFFSPSGLWIAFFSGGKLKKVATTGGAAVPICDALAGRGGTWLDEDTIVFTPNSVPKTHLLRVAASGGSPVDFTALGEGMTTQRYPQALPAGKGVLFTEHSSTTTFDSANVVVAPASGGVGKVVVRGGYYARYLPSGPGPSRGHILYFQQASVFAVPFDLDRLETTGPAMPVLDGVAGSADTAGGQFSFADDGTFVYVPGVTTGAQGREMNWILRDGKSSLVRQGLAVWSNPAFSTDGKRLAMTVYDGKQQDIFVYDLSRDTPTQLTLDPAIDTSPVWSPDDQHIVFKSDRGDGGVASPQLYMMNADGTGKPVQLTTEPGDKGAYSWHPSGKFLAFQEVHDQTGWDLMMLPLEGSAATGWKPGKPTVWLSTPNSELYPKISPDGRWVAYFANENGTVNEVYVRPFQGEGVWKVSVGGGAFPHWSKVGHELLYSTPQPTRIMAVPYTVVGNSFQADKPQPWTPTPIVQIGNANSFDIHPDGKRVVASVASEAGGTAHDTLVLISNFFDVLRTMAPAKK